MIVAVLVVAGVLAWVGSALTLDGISRSRRPSLAERLDPFQLTALADEVEGWLRSQFGVT